MDAITATIIAVVIMVIGMVALLLVVTRKAYNHKWDTDDNSGYPQPAEQEQQENTRT
ncbi:hypothetical protein [Paenibacillus marinisediminis]